MLTILCTSTLNVLFGGVGELILSAPIVHLLNAVVGPQVAYVGDVRLVEGSHRLEVYRAYHFRLLLHIRQQCALMLRKTVDNVYLVGGIAVLDFERVHGFNHGLHRHENVLIDDSDEAPLVIFCVATAVDNSHLLDERRLATLARACIACACSCLCPFTNYSPLLHSDAPVHLEVCSFCKLSRTTQSTMLLCIQATSALTIGARRVWRAKQLSHCSPRACQ